MAFSVSEQMITAAAVFLIGLGAFVFLSRPGAAMNRVLGALFLLRGASDLMYQAQHNASTPADTVMFHTVGHWYESVNPLLTLLLLHYLVPPRGRARWRWWAMGAAAVATLVLYPLVSEARVFVQGPDGFRHVGGPWMSAFFVFMWAVRGLAVMVAAHAASSPARSLLQRRQAGLVGLAFIFLMGHSMIFTTARATLGGEMALWSRLIVWVGAVVVAATLVLLPRIVQPFEGRARVAAWIAAGAPFAAGVADVFVDAPHFDSARPLMLAAHAVCLALAAIRYDLVHLGNRMQRRVVTFARAMLVSGMLLLPMGVALVFLGSTSAGLIVAIAMGTGAIAISPAPARSLARGFSRLLSPDPLDPAVAGERARVYAAALERHPAGAPELSRLRDELGLAEEEHQALSAIIAGRAGEAASRPPPILGRYLPDRELGRGAFGTAILARDLGTGRLVVLKRFHASWAEKRALAEAEALARVRHPRVVPLLSVEQAGDEVFLVLAYVEGGSAQDLLDASGPLPPARAVALVLDVLEGLEAIHAAGLAHGDVKPANVLLDAQGRALLTDLGAAQALARADADMTLTASPIVGSYATVAPEVLRGSRRSAAGDVYATGATLYRLLTGEPYVRLEGADVLRAAEAILHAPPRLPHPAIPPAVEAVLARALAKSPRDRHASAAQMRKALAEAAAALPPS